MIKKKPCNHKNAHTLVHGEYETGASTGYTIRHALSWCPACGGYEYGRGGWTLPRSAVKPRKPAKRKLAPIKPPSAKQRSGYLKLIAKLLDAATRS